jgi:hypothetical protein
MTKGQCAEAITRELALKAIRYAAPEPVAALCL